MMRDELFDWASFILGTIIGVALILTIAWIFAPSNSRLAEMDCNAFEEIYGDHFEANGKECLFQYEKISIPVEWDDVDNHKMIIYILEAQATND